MRKHIRFSILIAVVILLSLVGGNLTLAQQSGNSAAPSGTISQDANFPWSTQYAQHVSFPDDVGTYASLAIHPLTDLPYISYYDATNGNLILAHFVGNGGGDCGTNNNWHCEVLDGDNGDDVGTYTSIDMIGDAAAQTWRIGISYHDETHGALKFISWTCGPLVCTIHNKVTVTAPVSMLFNLGLYTSFRFDPSGIPHIVYQQTNSFSNIDALKIANFVDSGGNCGEGSAVGKWECGTIDSGEGIGQYASLDLTYDGTPYIAYYDANLGNLKIAYYTGFADPDCYLTNGWNCPVIDSIGNVGQYASITAQHSPSDKLFRVAYYDRTNKHLKYYDSDFGALFVDEMGSSPSHMGISMDVDNDGLPIIAYQQILSGDFETSDLRVARPYLAFDDGNFGNCGDTPPDYLFTYWRCNPIDDSGQYLNEADFVSVAVKSTNLAVVAYSEFYSYDAGDHATSLKVIYQKFQFPAFLPLINKP